MVMECKLGLHCEDDLIMWMTPKYCPNCGAEVEVTYGFRTRKRN